MAHAYSSDILFKNMMKNVNLFRLESVNESYTAASMKISYYYKFSRKISDL